MITEFKYVGKRKQNRIIGPLRCHKNSFRQLDEIKRTCENLISSTQTDLELFTVCQTNHLYNLLSNTFVRFIKFLLFLTIKTCQNCVIDFQIQHEQLHLRNQIEDILAENKTIDKKLEALKTTTVQITGESRDDATREKFTNDALLNIKKQIDSLEAVS